MYHELYSNGFCCQGVAVRQKQKIKWQETFKAACSVDPFFIDKSDFFLSLYSFDSGLVEHFKLTGNSVAGFGGACWCPFVWFDIDRENDLGTALADVRRLVEYLTQTPAGSDVDSGLFVPHSEAFLVFFSGSKGFHVGVPIAVFGDEVKPGKEFPAQYKRLAVEIARRAGVEIDKSVYDRQRLFRCPNSKHSKSGLYKIPLSYWEITTSLSVAEIRQRAQRPRRLVWTKSELDSVADVDAVRYSPAVEPVPGAVAVWNEAQADMFSALPSMGQAGKEDMEKHEAARPYCCENRFPDGSSVPRLRRDTLIYIRNTAPGGTRAVALYNAVCDCLRCGWNRQAVESLFYDVASKTGLRWTEVKHQIEGAFRTVEKEREEVYNEK